MDIHFLTSIPNRLNDLLHVTVRTFTQEQPTAAVASITSLHHLTTIINHLEFLVLVFLAVVVLLFNRRWRFSINTRLQHKTVDKSTS